MLAILTLINAVITEGGPLAVLGIKALHALAAQSGMTTEQLLAHARETHALDTAKIEALLAETAP